jgi:hypothetical protein
MLRPIGFSVMFMTLVALASWSNGTDRDRDQAKRAWIPLFNGKNLEGWRVIDGNATVVNGHLCLERNAEIRTVNHFGKSEFRMEYECEGPFVLTILEDTDLILDDLRLFREQQRKRPVEAYVSVEWLGGNLYRVTAAFSRAWAVSYGTNIVRSKMARYPLRIRVGPESHVRFKYIEVSGDGLGLD